MGNGDVTYTGSKSTLFAKRVSSTKRILLHNIIKVVRTNARLSIMTQDK
jgi:hypothetical protein